MPWPMGLLLCLLLWFETNASAFDRVRGSYFTHRLRPQMRLLEQSASGEDTSTIDVGRRGQEVNGTSSYLEQLSFERSSATYEDRKLPEMEEITTRESSLYNMIQVLRKSTEFRAVYLAEILGNFANAILPNGVSRQDEVKTHWIPGNPVDDVLPYRVDELKDLSRGDLCTLVIALGSCRCPLSDIVHIVRALRLARRMSSKLLYMGVTNAISRKNPLVAYAMLKESTQLTAVSFPSYSGLESGEDAGTSGGEVTDGYSEVSDEMGMYKGYLKCGVKDGYGTYVFNNGEIFEGFFIDGEMHEGRFRSNCGSVYEGQILHGKMHGKGIFKFSNGDVYEGDFCHSQRHGWGVFLSITEGNAERYEGQFYQNMKHGQGTVYMSFPHRHVYRGDFFQNIMHGNGTVYFENGDLYVGQLENNCPHGFGTYYCNLPPDRAPSGVDFEGLVRNSSSLLGREELSEGRDPDDLDDEEEDYEEASGAALNSEDEDEGEGEDEDEDEGGGAEQHGDNPGTETRSGGRGMRGDLLLDALREWEELTGRLDDRPAQREALRANRTFLGSGNSYVYVGEWRENQREGLGRLETMFYPPEGEAPCDARLLTVYDGEWRSNREHGVGELVTYETEGGGFKTRRRPKVKAGVWKAGIFEREHKGFKRPEPLSPSSPAGGATSAEKMASDLGASLPRQLHATGFDRHGAGIEEKENASDEFVKQHLQRDSDRSDGDGTMSSKGGAATTAEVSMSTITDRAALMKALESLPSSDSAAAPSVQGGDNLEQGTPRPAPVQEQGGSPRNEMLRSREGMIYIPRPTASQVNQDGDSEHTPIEEPGRLNVQARNGSQEEEDQERLWIEGYSELEPPGKDLEGDVEIRYTPLIDITTIDELLDELAYVGEVDTAVELTESLAIRKLGEGIVPTLSTYSTVAVSAGRLGRPDVMLRVLRYAVLEQSRRGLVLYSETLFLTALNICAISGDYHDALRVFNLYEGRYGVVQQKAYSLVLVSYISASHHKPDPDPEGDGDDDVNINGDSRRKEKVLARSQYRRSAADSSGASPSDNTPQLRAPPKLETLVEFLVSSNLDSGNHALASLILNFKAMQGDVGDSSAYFARVASPPRSQCPSSAALIAYADLLRTKREWTLARELVLYMDGRGLIPYPRLKRYVENNNIGASPLWAPSSEGSGGGRDKGAGATEGGSSPLNTIGQGQVANSVEGTVLIIKEPPPVNISGIPLSRTQLRRYHHYYVSPVLGQFQDPLVVEAVARKTKQRVKETTTVPDAVWRAALASQAGAGSNAAKARGDGGLLRPPSPTDLYLLQSLSTASSSKVDACLTRDTGELEGLLDFLLDLVALQVTPGPVPASIDLDISNPLIYEDVASITQTLAWECDYQCCFANAGVWEKLVELTTSMAAVGFEEDVPGGGVAGIKEAALLYPRISSKLLPSYFNARQRYLSKEGQEDSGAADEDEDEGELESAEVSDEGEDDEDDKGDAMPAAAGSFLNGPIDLHTKLLLRRRNVYMGLMSAALAHGNKHRLHTHQLDRKWVRMLHQIGDSGLKKDEEAKEEAANRASKQYRNYLQLGATVNTVNGGDIGKNNPQRGRLLDAQAAARQVNESSLPVIDAIIAVLELMEAEHDGILLAMLDPSFCQDMLSLLCRAGNAYGPVAGAPFKPMRATELRLEQFPKFQRVFTIISEAAIRHRDSSAVPRGHGDNLVKQMLTPFLSPCRFGAQPGCDSVLDLPSFLAFLEGDYSLNRLEFPSQVHERVLDGLFRAGERDSAKQYFESIEPSKAGAGALPRATLSAKVYETHINRLLREKDTKEALEVLKLLEEGPAAASVPLPGQAEGDHPDSLMRSLLEKEEEDSPAADVTDQLQAIIDEQLEQEQVPTPFLPGTKASGQTPKAPEPSPRLLSSSSLNPELRLMLNNLYSKVLNVYRATNRTKEARRLISMIRSKQLVLDVTQAHSLMDIEIKARNFAGALEIYDQFFPPAIDVPGSLLKQGDTELTSYDGASQGDGAMLGGGGITRECPELKAVVAMARALTRTVYPDSDLPESENAGDPSNLRPRLRGSGDGDRVDNTSSRRLAESAMGYILNVIHHFPELTRQTRSLSGVYGVVGRLARLATEAGNLEATLALYTFIPLRDRRLSPWSIIAKQMADCSSFGQDQPALGPSHLQSMQGRAELSLLLMRAEGQKGDQSGGMSPLSLINAVTAAPDSPLSPKTSQDVGHESILYDPYLQFTPPVDEAPSSDPNGVEVTGIVKIPSEVLGHAMKALLLPHPSTQHYSASLREATSRRAFTLAPALFSTMRSERQYPTWPLTLLFFAAGGLPSGAAAEARSLHYQAFVAHHASLGADLDAIASENELAAWTRDSVACISELDANLLLAAVLTAEVGEEERAYLGAVTEAMRHAGFKSHVTVVQALRSKGLDHLCAGLEEASLARVRQVEAESGGGLVLVGDALFVGLVGDDKVTHEEPKHGKFGRTMINLYGERIAADVLVKFQRGISEMEGLGQTMLELLSTTPAREDDDEKSKDTRWTLARLHAMEREVARLQETDFEPEVLYPGVAMPGEKTDGTVPVMPTVVGQKDGTAAGSTAHTLSKGANLGNLSRNLQGQNRRRVLRTARRKDKWQSPRD